MKLPRGKAIMALILSFIIITAFGCGQRHIKNEGDKGPGSTKEFRPQGSVNTLKGKSVLISVYVYDKNNPWKKRDIDKTEQYLAIATKWIVKEGDRYGKKVELIHHDSKHPDLSYNVADANLYKLSKDENKNNEYVREVNKYLKNDVIEKVKKKYETDSVGFIVFLNGAGVSFAQPYISKDYGKGYKEFATIYLQDGDSGGEEHENPATYAHEILHLFGAIDLYEENRYDHITEDVVEYIAKTYPREIMYTTYGEDYSSNFKGI